MKHRDVRDVLYEYARGELDTDRARRVEEHLAECNRCYAEFQILIEGIRLVQPLKGRPSGRRSDAYWHNLAVQVERQIKAGEKKRVPTTRLSLWWESLFIYRLRYAVSLASAAALVVLVLAAWPLIRSTQDAREELAEGEPEIAAQPLNTELRNYLRRSKVLLVGISNISVPNGQRVDLSVEREAARALVKQARYFDEQPIDERSQRLVKALEKILLELANMEDQVDLPEVEIVRAGIHEENMLFKIRMAEADFNRSASMRVISLRQN